MPHLYTDRRGCFRNMGWNSSLAAKRSVNSRTNSGPAPCSGSSNDKPPTCVSGCEKKHRVVGHHIRSMHPLHPLPSDQEGFCWCLSSASQEHRRPADFGMTTHVVRSGRGCNVRVGEVVWLKVLVAAWVCDLSNIVGLGCGVGRQTDDVNVVIGQAHFIEAVEDCTRMVGVGPSLRTGLALRLPGPGWFDIPATMAFGQLATRTAPWPSRPGIISDLLT